MFENIKGSHLVGVAATPRRLRSRFAVALATSALALGACADGIEYKPHRVSKHEEVGDVFVSATLVGRWEDYVERLSPKFELNSAGALAAAVPRTSISQEKVVDTLAAALKVAPPTSSTTASATTASENGETTTSSSKTKESGPGDLAQATSPGAPDSKITSDVKLPADADVTQDPFLRYTSATALYQEVQLLNRYLYDAVQEHHARPYVVRLQITTAPYARNQPYDTHLTVAFHASDKDQSDQKGDADQSNSGSDEGGSNSTRKAPTCDLESSKKMGDETARTTPPTGGVPSGQQSSDGSGDEAQTPKKDKRKTHKKVVAIPLLVTDNVEAQLNNRSANIVRQISAAAAVLQGGFAASIGLDSRLERLNAILANDFNSLLTVGRITSSTLSVRLGAMRAATAEYAMVPRNYNVTVLVLVQEPVVAEAAAELVRAEAEIRLAKASPPDSEQRKNLPKAQKERDAAVEKKSKAVDRSIRQTLRISGTVRFRDSDTGAALPRQGQAAQNSKIAKLVKTFAGGGEVHLDLPGKLLRAFLENDIAAFEACVKHLGDMDMHRQYVLWNEIGAAIANNGAFGDVVDLPEDVQPEYPKDQKFLLVDDGEKTMRAVLVGGRGLDKSELDATLTVPVEDGAGGSKPVTLPATSVEVGEGGASPTFVFPSLAAWGMKVSGTDSGSVRIADGVAIALGWKGVARYSAIYGKPKGNPPTITGAVYRKLKTEKDQYIALRSPTPVVAAKDRLGEARIHVDFKKVGGRSAASATLKVDGANLVSAFRLDDSKTEKENKLDVKFDSVSVSGEGGVKLDLGGLTDGAEISVSVKTKVDGAESAEPKPLIFKVKAVAPAK